MTASSDEPSSPRALAERRAADLLRELAGLADGGMRLRVTACEGGLACLVQVWEASAAVPTACTEKAASGAPKRAADVREQCREDVLAVIRAVGRPLTRKEVVRTLKDRGAKHGSGTVAKALADLTASRELVNRRDKRGYRLPEWIKRQPGLFDNA